MTLRFCGRLMLVNILYAGSHPTGLKDVSLHKIKSQIYQMRHKILALRTCMIHLIVSSPGTDNRHSKSSATTDASLSKIVPFGICTSNERMLPTVPSQKFQISTWHCKNKEPVLQQLLTEPKWKLNLRLALKFSRSSPIKRVYPISSCRPRIDCSRSSRRMCSAWHLATWQRSRSLNNRL